jgi:hypothetical protein
MIFSPRRFRRLFVLLALPFLLGAKGNTANEHVVCREGFLKIVSPDPLSVGECKQVARMAMEAWNFDLKQMNWSRSINMNRPLTLRVNSIERMRTRHPGVLGFAKSTGNLFVVSTAVLSDPLAKGTLAHELGHVQAFRALGGKPKLKVPHYFLEGHGLSMGRAYRTHLGHTKSKFDAGGARIVAKLTASEARLILTTNVDYYMQDGKMDTKKNRVMEAFGVFFVEYLRVRKGMPDAVARMGRVFELVGRGMTYGQAFKQTYGISVNQAISEITAFMARTQSDPSERLRKTRYDRLL